MNKKVAKAIAGIEVNDYLVVYKKLGFENSKFIKMEKSQISEEYIKQLIGEEKNHITFINICKL